MKWSDDMRDQVAETAPRFLAGFKCLHCGYRVAVDEGFPTLAGWLHTECRADFEAQRKKDGAR